MNLQLTPSQRDVQARAREICREHIAPRALSRDTSAEFPLDDLRRLADAGLMGVNIASDLGGLQAGVVAYSLAVQAVAKADPAVAVTMAVNNMVGEVLAYFGTESQKQTLVPKMTSGEFSSGSFCLSEPGSGSDAAGMLTRATRTPEGWRINGTKAWITSGSYAGVFLVWAQTSVEGDDQGISLFIVDPTLDGVSVGPPEEKMGQHASNTVSLAFDHVLIPGDALLGELGKGFRIAMMALDGGRIGIASQSIGIADAALELAAEAGVGNHPQSADAFEMMHARIEAARQLTLRAAWLKEVGSTNFSREASMAKLMASEVANDVARRCLALVGPSAAAYDHPLAKLVRDARVTRIYEGTSEIQRVVIARDLIRNGAA
ncbi:acyl-CoA dehydrogenase [Bradymonadaceae bacterium TMQ3]|uniref:Acyl-CoA dehydrogenase n=1 Tax=Lujinxingia sediminis TaxID=2480984 RepID=A0ABY0CZ05_9DELT|nr:acyl-CoA dehydrogenase family protein [Lujinxingia sediminis]RDV39286.1 acyl-CoA dehydrogenase [Bradymonadaceae bacterium TMQ3]RVU48675.1 acyl-CoA dehydrogenase [Lujinxingia sediminis]TXC77968.1 acyl-CoA dehydrogenase [Bradymonadales bacterium TMQ1]